MAGPGKKWLLGCGLGCGIPILLSIVLTIGGGIVMMKPFTKAVDSQKALVAAHGEREEFVPAAGGLTAERLEKFMAVRQELVPLCANFTEIGEKFQKLDKLDADGEEPSKGELFSAIGDVMGAAFGIASNIGRFTQARNEALLAQEMALGEYIWIYTLVYNSWLGYEPNTDFESDGNSEFGASDRRIIRRLMRNHAEALVAAGRAAEATQWRAEADHLERADGDGVPWTAHDLPENVAAAFEPHRAALDELFCAATAAFEFSKMKKRGFSITSE